MWTLSKELEKRLDGTYTSEITCSCTGSESLLEEPSNKGRNLRRTSIYLQNRGSKRARFAGHCFRAKDQVISDLLLWRQPCPRRGNRPLTYPDTLARDTGHILNELAQAMANRTLWCDIVSVISTAVN